MGGDELTPSLLLPADVSSWSSSWFLGNEWPETALRRGIISGPGPGREELALDVGLIRKRASCRLYRLPLNRGGHHGLRWLIWSSFKTWCCCWPVTPWPVAKQVLVVLCGLEYYLRLPPYAVWDGSPVQVRVSIFLRRANRWASTFHVRGVTGTSHRCREKKTPLPPPSSSKESQTSRVQISSKYTGKGRTAN